MIAFSWRTFQTQWVYSPQIAALNKLPIRSPSFPHALSGNQADSELDPRKNIRGDALKTKLAV
jgi:hypothetical protein